MKMTDHNPTLEETKAAADRLGRAGLLVLMRRPDGIKGYAINPELSEVEIEETHEQAPRSRQHEIKAPRWRGSPASRKA